MAHLDLLDTGAYFRAGGGNVQRPDDQKQTITWAAWNLDNGQPDAHGAGIAAFALAVSMWESAGIPTFPWVHCRTLYDVRRLVSYCKSSGRRALGLNLEDVESDFVKKGIGLDAVAKELDSWPHAVHMATLPWVQNPHGGSTPLDWHPLQSALEGRLVTALEIFCDGTEATGLYPGGKYSADITGQCIEHAFDVGFDVVTLMFQTKQPWKRENYGDDYAIVHSLYTGDDIGVGAELWASWDFDGEPLVPVPPNEGDDMEKIGADDGIKATMDRLRTMDPAGTRLVLDAKGKWPPLDTLTIPLKDWKAYDKFERAQRILKDDHDAAA